jgi:cyclopropane fatty-acyl-phospholipid synthase-like methyltransferase
MNPDILHEIDKYSFRRNLRRFALKAFESLPAMSEPKILVLGCGTGVSVIELALLTDGSIDAADDDEKNLRTLKEAMEALRLQKNVRTIRCSYEKLKMKKEYYDVIWSEGAVNTIGFERGIREWKKFLKADGFLVIHDEIYDYKRKIEAIPACGYSVIKYFVIPSAIWMNEYFKPLESKINALKEKYAENKKALDLLDQEGSEIGRFKTNPEQFSSVYYVLKNYSK